MAKRNKAFIGLAVALVGVIAFAKGRIQNEDVKSYGDLQTSVLTTTGSVSSGTNCITSVGSLAHLAVGQFIYDQTTNGNITLGTTIAGLPGSCSSGQIQMSLNAAGSGTGDSISFGGQLSQLVNDSKIYVSANGINDTLFNAITNNAFGTGAGASNTPYTLQNFSFSTSVSANALTIAAKDSAGANPSVGSPVKISMRSVTATSSLYNLRTLSSAQSLVVPSSASLGCTSGSNCYIYIYELDNVGTLEMAVSSIWRDDSQLTSSTAISGSATDWGLYSTTSRSNVPFRLVGRIKYNTAPNGLYTATPDQATPLSLASDLFVEETQAITGVQRSCALPCAFAYGNIPNANVTLQPGKYWLTGSFFFSASGSTFTYQSQGGGWYSTPASNSATQPTTIPATTTISFYAGGSTFQDYNVSKNTDVGGEWNAPTIYVEVNSTTTLYMSPSAQASGTTSVITENAFGMSRKVK